MHICNYEGQLDITFNVQYQLLLNWILVIFIEKINHVYNYNNWLIII